MQSLHPTEKVQLSLTNIPACVFTSRGFGQHSDYLMSADQSRRWSVLLTSSSSRVGFVSVHVTDVTLLLTPTPAFLSLHHLHLLQSPMLPQATLSLPIMLCSARKSKAKWLCCTLLSIYFLLGLR